MTSLLADAAVWHVVVAFNIRVLIRRDLQSRDRHALPFLSTGDAWAVARRTSFANGTSNALGLETVSFQEITLA